MTRRASCLHAVLFLIPAFLPLTPCLAAGNDLFAIGSVEVRASPLRTADAVGRASAGDKLVFLGDASASYLRVELADGTKGWVHRSGVMPVPVAPIARIAAGATDFGEPTRVLSGDQQRAFRDRHLSLGTGQTVHLCYREGYAVAVDSRLRIPVWVQYELTADELDGPGERGDSRFRADEAVPGLARAEVSDYHGSGFDRGHMAPAADMTRSQPVMDESFLLSNISPQVGLGFNRDIWRQLEEATRNWVRARGTLTIVTGPVFRPDNDAVVRYDVIGENEVAVPNAFFKIVIDRHTSGGPKAIAFILPNQPMYGERLEHFLVSVDEIEAATGIDFFSEFEDASEDSMEQLAAERLWPVGEHVALMASQVNRDVRLELVEVDRAGRFKDRDVVNELVEAVRSRSPTHVFLLAHGWNNSRSDALVSYQRFLDSMGQIADEHDLRPDQYRPVVIGMHWPSKAWDDQSRTVYSAAVGEDLTLSICEVLPPERSGGTYLEDVTTLRELLSSPESKHTKSDRAKALGIFRKYSAAPPTPEDESIFDGAATGDEGLALTAGPQWSIRDLFRVFTFWQMKKRAGEVGCVGGRQLLAELQAAAPEAEFHLGGHSFGCKLLLSAIGERSAPPTRPVDSLVLLQAAVSTYSFADRVPDRDQPGGYKAVLEHDRVRGPIVATYSSQDWPLRYAYPVGSRLAGQTGEVIAAGVSPYGALGAVGATGLPSSALTLHDVGHDYQLDDKLFVVNGSDFIDGHSEIYGPEVAWLVWSAILVD